MLSEPLNDRDLEFSSANVVVLAAERTFWEKATLIHAECNRGTMRASAARLSRHWHDLHLLNASEIGKSALEDTQLLRDVVKHKKCFFRNGFANYDACLEKGFKLIPEKFILAELQKDYRNMRDMVYGDAPVFNDIIDSLRSLETEINTLIV